MPGICYQYAESGTCRYGDRCKFLHTPESVGNTKAKAKAKRSNRYNKATRNKKKPLLDDSTNHLLLFFSEYPSFDYDPGRSSTAEFYRMCDQFAWDKEDTERVEAREDFQTALVKQFNELYGTEVDSIESWRGLCFALDIMPLPDNVQDAKEIFQSLFINLVDLVDNGLNGASVVQFRSLKELQEYTVRTGKFFPKESAYAGGMLKHLLREILSTHRRRRA